MPAAENKRAEARKREVAQSPLHPLLMFL